MDPTLTNDALTKSIASSSKPDAPTAAEPVNEKTELELLMIELENLKKKLESAEAKIAPVEPAKTEPVTAVAKPTVEPTKPPKRKERPTIDIELVPCEFYYDCEDLSEKGGEYDDYCCATFYPFKRSRKDTEYTDYCYPRGVISEYLNNIVLPDGKKYLAVCMVRPSRLHG